MPLIQPVLVNSNKHQDAFSLPQRFGFSTSTANEEDKKPTPSSYREQATQGAKSFGGMMKLYGPAFVGTYLGIYATNLGLFYLGIESGALDPMTILGYVTGNHEEVRSSAEVVSELLEHYTITAPFADTVKAKPNLANFAIAWVSTKFTEPIRFGLAVAVVPRVARALGIVPKAEEAATTEGDAADEKADGETSQADVGDKKA